jgi:hypothetical protein
MQGTTVTAAGRKSRLRCNTLNRSRVNSATSLRSYETQIRKFLETDYSLVTDPAGQRAAEQLSDLYRQIDETQHEINTKRRLLEILKKEEEDTRQLLSVSRSSNVEQQITVIRSRILDLQLQAEDYYIERPELRQFPERNANLKP